MNSSNSGCAHFRVADPVGWRKVDDRVVVADVFSGRSFILEDVEAFIWQHIAENQPVAEIVSLICQAYSVDRTTAEADLAEFIAQLVDAELITGAE
ncbi:MAG: PqqD family protein [Bdellovibrionales bacterium]|nr:PqqD family protein [Bdellovibrionales bacterium]